MIKYKELIMKIVSLFLNILFTIIIAGCLIIATNFISGILAEHIFNLNCGSEVEVYDPKCNLIFSGTSISLILLSIFILIKTIKKIERSNKKDLKENEE